MIYSMSYTNSHKTNIIHGVREESETYALMAPVLPVISKKAADPVSWALNWCSEYELGSLLCKENGAKWVASGKQAFEDPVLDQIWVKKMVTRKWQERNHVLHWENQRAVTKHSIFTEQLRTERVWDTTSPTRVPKYWAWVWLGYTQSY